MIRKAKATDVKEIITLAKSTKIFTNDEILCLDSDLQEYFAAKNDDTILVYEIDKKILGFTQFGPLPITDNSWMLHWIAVSKQEQKAGIGKKLIQRAEATAKKKRARIMFIETSSKDEFEVPRNFYMRNGFMPISVVTDYYGIYDSKVIFSKNFMDLCPRIID